MCATADTFRKTPTESLLKVFGSAADERLVYDELLAFPPRVNGDSLSVNEACNWLVRTICQSSVLLTQSGRHH